MTVREPAEVKGRHAVQVGGEEGRGTRGTKGEKEPREMVVSVRAGGTRAEGGGEEEGLDVGRW